MSELGSQLPPAGPLAFRYLSTNSDFPDVTLACEYGLQLQAHQLILAPPSPFKMGSRTCVNFLQASLGEFLSVWRMGGTATLHLNTSGGTVKGSPPSRQRTIWKTRQFGNTHFGITTTWAARQPGNGHIGSTTFWQKTLW